jgi:hypothetical protein
MVFVRALSPFVHKPKVQEALKKLACLLALDHNDIPFLMRLIQLEVSTTRMSMV